MRKTGIALSAFALALTLGACGASGDSGNGGAANNNSDAAAANVAELARSVGDQASAKSSAHVTMSGNFGGEQVDGEGDVSFAANPAMSIDMTMSQGEISMVLVDEIVYIKMAGQEAEAGKPWVKIDTNSDNPLAKVFATLSGELSKNADPRTALAQFEEAGEITATREEELDGKQTTHYTIMVDVERLAQTKADEPTQKAALDAAIKAGLKDFPVELWLDEEQLPVRVSFDMPAPDGKGGTTPAKMRMDYTDWGKTVDIAPPPADQVAELPSS